MAALLRVGDNPQTELVDKVSKERKKEEVKMREETIMQQQPQEQEQGQGKGHKLGRKFKPRKTKVEEVKYCHCGHLIEQHEYSEYGGCTAIIEGSECEDHWRCGCIDIQAIHINMHRRESIARMKKNSEQA